MEVPVETFAWTLLGIAVVGAVTYGVGSVVWMLVRRCGWWVD